MNTQAAWRSVVYAGRRGPGGAVLHSSSRRRMRRFGGAEPVGLVCRSSRPTADSGTSVAGPTECPAYLPLAGLALDGRGPSRFLRAAVGCRGAHPPTVFAPGAAALQAPATRIAGRRHGPRHRGTAPDRCPRGRAVHVVRVVLPRQRLVGLPSRRLPICSRRDACYCAQIPDTPVVSLF